ncbi:MAG: alpha-L-fucosidase [Oscillospiraceae bacterium]
MKDTKQEWFKEAKYGLFIHWGLFSILGGEYEGKRTNSIAEWIMHDFSIAPEDYRKLATQFNPTAFDARDIVKKAKEWGMKYIVFTAKHHEGFAMYHSKCNQYNVVDATPFGRDVLKELQLACEEFGIKLCLYYSQAQDWDDPNGAAAHSDNTKKDFRKYLNEKCKPQIQELLTQYGEIGLIWFDTPVDMSVQESAELFNLVKECQPNCIVSGRIGNGMGEYMTTGDNFIPSTCITGDWEVPATLNDTWGYSATDENWKNANDILNLLVKINSRGGNYLLNVGPDAMGNIPAGSVHVLDEVGKYVTNNSDALFATKLLGNYCYDIAGIQLTRKDYKLFMHILKNRSKLEILNIGNTVEKVYVLEDNKELDYVQSVTCEGDSYIEVFLSEELKIRENYCICLKTKEKNPIFEPLQG